MYINFSCFILDTFQTVFHWKVSPCKIRNKKIICINLKITTFSNCNTDYFRTYMYSVKASVVWGAVTFKKSELIIISSLNIDTNLCILIFSHLHVRHNVIRLNIQRFVISCLSWFKESKHTHKNVLSSCDDWTLSWFIINKKYKQPSKRSTNVDQFQIYTSYLRTRNTLLIIFSSEKIWVFKYLGLQINILALSSHLCQY